MAAHRVAIAGIGTESSTFTPHRTTLDDFTVWRGEQLAVRYPFLRDWRLGGAEFVPVMVARAQPGGPVTPEAYLALETELLQRLRAARPGSAGPGGTPGSDSGSAPRRDRATGRSGGRSTLGDDPSW